MKSTTSKANLDKLFSSIQWCSGSFKEDREFQFLGKGEIDVKVESSAIASLGYEFLSEKLFVEFNSGSYYSYDDVPLDVFVELVTADSIGRHFVKNVRNVYTPNNLGTLSAA